MKRSTSLYKSLRYSLFIFLVILFNLDCIYGQELKLRTEFDGLFARNAKMLTNNDRTQFYLLQERTLALYDVETMKSITEKELLYELYHAFFDKEDKLIVVGKWINQAEPTRGDLFIAEVDELSLKLKNRKDLFINIQLESVELAHHTRKELIVLHMYGDDPVIQQNNLLIIDENGNFLNQQHIFGEVENTGFSDASYFGNIKNDGTSPVMKWELDLINFQLLLSDNLVSDTILKDLGNGFIIKNGGQIQYKDRLEGIEFSFTSEDVAFESGQGIEPHYITDVAISPDKKHAVIIGAPPTAYWAVVGSDLRGQGSRFLLVYDLENKEMVGLYSEGGEAFVSCVWLDNKSYLVNDSGINFKKEYLDPRYPLRSFTRTKSQSVAMHVDGDFNKILYSKRGDQTGLFSISEVEPIRKLNDQNLQYLDGNDQHLYFGTHSFDHGQRNMLMKNGDTIAYDVFFEAGIEDSEVTNDGDYVAYATRIMSNFFIQDTEVKVEEYLSNQEGASIGFRTNSYNFYKKKVEKTRKGDQFFETINFGSHINVVNVADTDLSFTILSEIYPEDISFSRSGKYLLYGSNDTWGDSNEYRIFDIERRAWKYLDSNNTNSIVYARFDEHSDLAIAVYKDSRFIVWNSATGTIIDADFIPEMNDITEVAFNSKTKEIWIRLGNRYGILNYETKTWQVDPILNFDTTGVFKFSKDGAYLFKEFYQEEKSRSQVAIYDYPAMNLLYTQNIVVPFDVNQYKGRSELLYFHEYKPIAWIHDGYGKMDLINLKPGLERSERKTATLKIMDESDWIVYTPQGYFDASKLGREKIYYTADDEVILYGQIKEKYWVPGLLDKLINKPQTFNADVLSRDIDLYPDLQFMRIDRTDEYEIILTERTGGIGRVSLYINDKEVAEDLNPQRAKRIKFDLSLYEDYLLEESTNKISVKAYNASGWIHSRKNNVYVYFDGNLSKTIDPDEVSPDNSLENAQGKKPGLFGLFVGSSKYMKEDLNLRFADADADSLSNAFSLIAKNMYDENRIFLKSLTSESLNEQFNSGKENILNALDTIAQKAESHDIVVLFFSGHGITIDDDFYYLTKDAGNVNVKDDVNERGRVSVSSKEINEALRKVKATKQLLVMDACHSGKITQVFSGGGKALSSSQEKALEFLEDKMGVFVLASSESNQKSFESVTLGQGLLTFALLMGMSGEAAQNNIINIIDLLNYAAKSSEELGKMVLSKSQRPVLGIKDGASSFPIGFINPSLKKDLPQQKMKMSRPKFAQDQLYNDPIDFERDVLNKLKERGAIGSDDIFSFYNSADDETYNLAGKYEITAEGRLKVTWNIFKGEQLIKSGMTYENKLSKKSKIANLIITRSLREIQNPTSN